MKRTKKMMLVTLMATTAVAMLLMSKAFAAPVGITNTNSTQNLLSQLSNSQAAGTTASNCPKSQALQQILNQNGVAVPTNLPASVAGTTASNCPKSQALQQILNQNGVAVPTNLPASVAGTTASNCPRTKALQQLANQNGIPTS